MNTNISFERLDADQAAAQLDEIVAAYTDVYADTGDDSSARSGSGGSSPAR
jgi:hypothetical protein